MPELLHVAFFRAMNLGQRRFRSPTSAELLAAFDGAGAVGVVNVQSNGTVIFGCPGAAPGAVLGRVQATLRADLGYADIAVVREADWVTALAEHLDPGLVGGEVTLFDAVRVPRLALPWTEAEHGELTVHALDLRHAVTSWSSVRSGSNATTVLTEMVGTRVTSRGIPTMLRLANRLERLQGIRPT